jgi:Protein of unknown function (DUF3443)
VHKSLAVALFPLVLAGCGGGGGGGGGGGNPPPPQANAEPLLVDAGPTQLPAPGAVNTAYVSVKVCVPGSTTACQTIDHIEVDTGSMGLRLLADAPLTVALPPLMDSSMHLLAECLMFADGASWGSLATADVEMPTSGEKVSGLVVQVIGSADAGTPPAACNTPAVMRTENTVPTFGANGILGVGIFVNDCNSTGNCVPQQPLGSATYYACASNPCTPGTATTATASLSQQVWNPVAKFASDNNGVIVELPAVPSGGATNPAGGMLVFGIGTQSDNALGSATVATLNGSGALSATLNGSLNFAQAFLDSGSDGNFFDDSSLVKCTDNAAFYCPANAPVPESAVLTGSNNAKLMANFDVGNADTLFTSAPTAVPELAGPGVGGSFDLGLPFFFGHHVYFGFETNSGGAYLAY